MKAMKTEEPRREMKRFWNVLIEIAEAGGVKAAVLWSRTAAAVPRDGYSSKPGWEAYSLWYASEAEARGAVAEARDQSFDRWAVK